MIEIVFGESACASLKMAQGVGKGKYPGGSVGVIISHDDGSKPTRKEIADARRNAEAKARMEWESAVPLGGSAQDVFGFSLALSVGDISENEPGAQRRRVLEQLYSVYPNNEGICAAKELLEGAKGSLKTVCARSQAGEAIRIWYSDQPDELCGLYWLLSRLYRLEGFGGQVYVIKLPEWILDENGNAVSAAGWGEVAPGNWSRFLSLQKAVPPVLVQNCAAHWQALEKENAPLRAVVNGRLTSMPETLYDSFILREIMAEKKEFQEAAVIGRVLGKYRLGVSDCWLALRIEEMVRDGRLAVVSAPAGGAPAYHRVLKLRNVRQG